jgi:hypothetical protein
VDWAGEVAGQVEAVSRERAVVVGQHVGRRDPVASGLEDVGGGVAGFPSPGEMAMISATRRCRWE